MSIVEKTEQKNNTAHLLAGNDIHQNVNVLPGKSKLGLLYEKLSSEKETDKSLSGFISKLEVFTRVVDDEEVQGLENKLSVAGRQSEIAMASAQKEHVFKNLMANKHSPTYQEIYAMLMGRIYGQFKSAVSPMIESGSDKGSVNSAVNEHVVEPLKEEIDNCGAIADVDEFDIWGMIYFLTGNCHIKWV